MARVKNGEILTENATDIMRGDGTFAPFEAFPVGSVFTSTVSTNPNTLLGYGTWAQIGAGRVLVGQNASDADFDTLKKTGGAKTHTLTVNEIPAHNHQQTVNSAATGALSGYTADTSTNTPINSGYSTANTGGGQAHNNMPPFLVVIFWERTA